MGSRSKLVFAIAEQLDWPELDPVVVKELSEEEGVSRPVSGIFCNCCLFLSTELIAIYTLINAKKVKIINFFTHALSFFNFRCPKMRRFFACAERSDLE